MANMSYCRNENTYNDLIDCIDNLSIPAKNERDERYRIRLIELLIDTVESGEAHEALEVRDEEVDEDEEPSTLYSLEDSENNRLSVGDKLKLIDADDVNKDVPGLLEEGDFFTVKGGYADNIVSVIRNSDGEEFGLFGERFIKVFE